MMDASKTPPDDVPTAAAPPTGQPAGRPAAASSSVRRRLVMAGVIVALLAAGYLAILWSGAAAQLGDEASLRAWFASFGAIGPLMVIGLEAVAVVLSPLPSAPIAIAAGAVYGSLWGTVYIVIGAELGSITAFLIARLIGYDLVRRWIPKGRLFDLLERERSQTILTVIVFASRLVPFLSFDAVSYAAGLTPLTFWRFAVATLLGVIPIAFLLNHVGADLVAGGSPLAFIILVTLAITSAAPFAWAAFRRWRRGPAG